MVQVQITLYWSFTVCMCLPDIGNCDKTNDVRGELGRGGREGRGGVTSHTWLVLGTFIFTLKRKLPKIKFIFVHIGLEDIGVWTPFEYCPV